MKANKAWPVKPARIIAAAKASKYHRRCVYWPATARHRQAAYLIFMRQNAKHVQSWRRMSSAYRNGRRIFVDSKSSAKMKYIEKLAQPYILSGALILLHRGNGGASAPLPFREISALCGGGLKYAMTGWATINGIEKHLQLKYVK